MDIPRYELIASFVLWTAAVGYSISGVIQTRKTFEYYEDIYGDFKQGWLIHGLRKDAADYEWEMTLQLLSQIYPWFIIHTVVSEYLRQAYFQVLPYWQLILSLLCIVYTTSVIGAIIIILQPLIFNWVFKFHNLVTIWCCSGICLLLICFLKSLNATKEEINLIGLNELQHYLIIVASCWINLRCISYYIDNINSKHHKVIHTLSYCLYLPTLFLGPFMLYTNFEKSQQRIEKSQLKMRINRLLINIVHFGFWFLFTEFALHFAYINALSFQPKIVQSFDNWSLYGYGYCMGQFFHLKYVILYGLSTSISRFEYMTPPATPKCIGRIHLYSDMWKYFDEGLYKFLIRYIYLPTLGNNESIKHKMFSSFLCFSFVFVWHGIYQHIFIWAALNYFGIFVENMFAYVVKNLDQKSRLTTSRKWRHRLSCIAASPLLAMSAVSNFYFFAGTQIGNIFVERFFNSSLLANLSLLFFLCCCCYVSTEVKTWEKGAVKKKLK